MIRKSIFAVFAIASISAAALATTATSADARPGFKSSGHRYAGIHRFHHRPHFHRHYHVKWHRPYVYGAIAAPVLAAPAYAAVPPKPAAPAANACLTKEYTKDNLVVFMDRCTKEAAASPIGGQPQQGEAQPQAGDTEPVPTK
jgi:hypothetical protein